MRLQTGSRALVMRLYTTLLDDEVARVENAMLPIKDSWVETSVPIVSDGWKDARNHPLVNVLAVSTKSAMFLKVVDCEDVKAGTFIANILIQAIEQVGPHNVVQVITDNAKNCKVVGLLVVERYEHIFWTPCVVHSLNLMLQKIGTKVDWIKKMYEEAQEIQMFVTNHHMTQAIFKQFSKLELLKVASSSSSERNWSTYSFIHSIKCNQLNSKKADNLVFVHSNLRLTTHKENTYKKREAKQWDVKQEAAELEVHIDALAIEDGDLEIHSTDGIDLEAMTETKVETIDASGTNCASNQQLPNDDEFFDDFL